MATFWAFFYKGGEGVLFGKIICKFSVPRIHLFWIGFIRLLPRLCFLLPHTPCSKERKFLLIAGSVCIVAFIILRYFNIYGDPHAWVSGKNFIYSSDAILRTTKYPVSLLYALMTLGPLCLYWV